MRILVTGASGFIGSHVTAALLDSGHEVIAIVRPAPQRKSSGARTKGSNAPVELDLENEDEVRKTIGSLRVDSAVHLAWPHAAPGNWSSPEHFDQVRIARTLAESLARTGCGKIVAAGTCFEYEARPGPLDEATTPLRPRTSYGAAKLACHEALTEACKKTGMALAWCRIFYVYGPGERDSRLVPSIIRSITQGDAAKLTDGNQIRDYLYVADVARALLTAATGGYVGAVNVGSGAPTSVREIALSLSSLLGRPEAVIFGAIKASANDPPSMVAATDRLRQCLKFRPNTPLQQGLLRTINWWQERLPPTRA